MRRSTREPPGVDWRGLGRSSDGLVDYLGLHKPAPGICEELIRPVGLGEETQRPVIQQGTVRGFSGDLVSYLGVLGRFGWRAARLLVPLRLWWVIGPGGWRSGFPQARQSRWDAEMPIPVLILCPGVSRLLAPVSNPS